MSIKNLLLACLLLLTLLSQAQVIDSLLPFDIAKEKRLSDEDLTNKKEGTYITGAPDLSSDPVNGFGFGVEGSIFFNGKKTDPFFAYTPYRARLDLVLFTTTKSQREFMAKLDIPYIFDTKWRLRVEGGYESNPNLLYFGNTEASLRGLTYYPKNDSTQSPVTDAEYKDYDASLTGTNSRYHNYNKQEAVLNISMEHSYLDGKLRILLGYEGAYVNFTTFPGNSLLQNDYEAGKVVGLQKGFVQLFQAGLIYDTRDLETDPSSGVFAELTNELSLKPLGSLYEFNKTFGHFNIYRKILPKLFGKCILAGRVAFGYTALNAPFFEYQDEWSSEGSIEGLGGPTTLRGYKQSRFLSRAMSFNNLELRCRFAQAELFKQHLAFSAVPFADAGGVWDNLSRLDHFENFRFSEGLGLRIAWNVNTILRFDYAFSPEDRQFFFNLSHAF